MTNRAEIIQQDDITVSAFYHPYGPTVEEYLTGRTDDATDYAKSCYHTSRDIADYYKYLNTDFGMDLKYHGTDILRSGEWRFSGALSSMSVNSGFACMRS